MFVISVSLRRATQNLISWQQGARTLSVGMLTCPFILQSRSQQIDFTFGSQVRGNLRAFSTSDWERNLYRLTNYPAAVPSIYKRRWLGEFTYLVLHNYERNVAAVNMLKRNRMIIGTVWKKKENYSFQKSCNSVTSWSVNFRTNYKCLFE